MQRLLLLAALLLLAPAVASAQDDTPAAEVFGGYSYLRTDDDLSSVTSVRNLHGWEGSVAFNVNRWLGIEADFSGHYGSDSVTEIVTPPFPTPPGFPAIGFTFDTDASEHTFLFGPKLSARGERVTPYAHALFGAARRRADVLVTPVAPAPPGVGPLQFDNSETAFAMALGGGVDVNLTDNVAIRAVQADYVMTRFDGIRDFDPLDDAQHNARISVGIVIRFGNR